MKPKFTCLHKYIYFGNTVYFRLVRHRYFENCNWYSSLGDTAIHFYSCDIFWKAGIRVPKPGWWDPGIRTDTGAGDTVWQILLNLYYSTFLSVVLTPPFCGYWYSVSEGVISSSWKCWSVIGSTAFYTLLRQPLLPVHSTTLTVERGLKPPV